MAGGLVATAFAGERALSSASRSSAPDKTSAAHQPSLANTPSVADYAKLPLAFEPNVGQADAEARFIARTGAGSLALTPTGSTLTGAQGSLRQHFIGANPNPAIAGADALPGKVNYLRGDPSTWRSNVATFAKVHYQDVYPGIDVAYYGNAGTLEYDLIVAPGADPSTIAFATEGATGARLESNGDLVMNVGEAEVRHRRPVAYQESAGARTPVTADYNLDPDGRVTFALAPYDATRPLVIDPLVYSTFVGGNGGDTGAAVALDGAGNTYVVGQTESANFPVAGTPLQATNNGRSDAFVAKLNPSGSAFVYSTYTGGADDDTALGVAVDAAGNAYVAGTTRSSDFPGATVFAGAPPLTFNASQPHVFVAKLNPTGSALVYSKFLGGSLLEEANAITIDGAGNAYVTGRTRSSDFPVVGGFQAVKTSFSDAAFVAKVNPTGSALVYSSYLSGSGEFNIGRGMAVDGSGNAYVVGETNSSDFPMAGTPVQGSQPGQRSGFVTKVNPSGSALVYSTYLGGAEGDVAHAVALDGAGHAYVTGYAESSDFPTAGTPFQAAKSGGRDAFVAKVNPSGSGLVYSTFVGGTGTDTAFAIAVGGDGVAHVGGATSSSNYPTVNPLQAFKKSEDDAFVTDVSAIGSAVLFSTYLGGNATDEARGVAADAEGNVYVAGFATPDFPIAGSPAQGSFGGGHDAFVAKISPATGSSSTPPPTDFDGDGDTDISVFRPSSGQWYVNGQPTTSFGLPGDIAVPFDYDNDDKADMAVFRPSVGGWYISGASPFFFGLGGDLPVPGDYDGDGFGDIAVFRPSVGGWYLNGEPTTFFGLEGDIPVPGDYDGNGTTDMAVFRASVGGWYINTPTPSTTFFGTDGDIPVPGDYDGNGTTDIAVFRPSVGGWYINIPTPTTTFWGLAGDVPVPGDYDADATTDIAVFRPDSGTWYINTPTPTTTSFGLAGDVPLPLPAAIQIGATP